MTRRHLLIEEEERGKLMSAGSDVISKAEAIIDALIETWPRHEHLTVSSMHKRLRTFLWTRKQYDWYGEHFTEGGWNTLISHRLKAVGR